MIERPRIGVEYFYLPPRGKPVRIRVEGFRGVSWVITAGVEDGRRRDVSRHRLGEICSG